MRRANKGIHSYFKLQNRYEILTNHLNEKYHVFNNDDNYDNAIREAINNCISNKGRKVKINNVTYIKTKINYNFITISTIKLYINFHTGTIQDCYNLAYPDANKDFKDPFYPVYKDHIEKIPKIINGKIQYKNIKVIDTISIVCEVNQNTSVDECLTMIRHELIHVLHEIRKSIINVRAGHAYYYANLICQYNNINFPDTTELKKLNAENITQQQLIQIFAGSLYYLDTSEYSAWLDCYYTQCKSYMQYLYKKGNKVNDNFINTTLTYPDAWQNVFVINKILVRYKSEIQQLINQAEFKIILKDFYKDSEIKAQLNVKTLIEHYLKRSMSFLKKCKMINYNLINNL